MAHAVWLYFRFPLSRRLVGEMLLERGIVASCETIRRRAGRFGADYPCRLERKAPGRDDIWRLEKMAIAIRGEKRSLWRAVDWDCYVLDEIVQIRRDAALAQAGRPAKANRRRQAAMAVTHFNSAIALKRECGLSGRSVGSEGRRTPS